MEKLILKLAGIMLKDYGERLSNGNSNDPTDEVNKIVSQFKEGEFDKFLDKWNGGECEDGKYYNWIISAAIGEELIKMSEKVESQ